jgi:hypothetical protein
MTAGREQVRSSTEIAHLDARWFRAHPERRHRVRRAAESEVLVGTTLADGPLLMAMRWTGKGCLYQPFFYDASPPRHERMASILFAMAASELEPVPFIRSQNAIALARRVFNTSSLT